MSEEYAEATINPDGTFENDAGAGAGAEADPDDMGGEDGFAGAEGEAMFEEDNETDPVVYLVLLVVLIASISIFIWYRAKKDQGDAFFDSVDGEKFDLKLPDAVEEYDAVRAQAEKDGWEPGQGPKNAEAAAASGPHRNLAQALMKRCIADIPIVTHIQQESSGMNKLYSSSMCSVKQWRSYQQAEALVSAEVDAVRAEADEIEPGWSQVIWRQAMQYHNMLKQRHEAEAKAAKAQVLKQKGAQIEPVLSPEEKAKQKEIAAEKAAKELIAMEEREQGKSGMKKGFIAGGTKKK